MTTTTPATTASATRPPSYFSGIPNGRRALDVCAVAVLFVIALLGFHHVYGGVQYLLTGVMALVFGTLIALIGGRWRWGPLRIAPLVLLVYFLFGPMFAAPTRAIWGIIPSPGALWELVKAPVTSWKSVLTVAPPVGTAQGVLGVVWISVLLLSLLGMSVVMRSRLYVLAWLFPLALVAVTIVFGTDQHVAPGLRGVLYAVVSMAWLTWRFEGDRLAGARSTIISDSVRPGSWQNPVLRRRVIGGALVMALAGGGAVAAQPLLDPPEGTIRYATRDYISPPFDPREYVSPLSEFRGYLKDQRAETLFTITGVGAGEYIRLATMDYYDLQVYNVAGNRDKDSASGAFLRTAPGVDLHAGGGQEQVSSVTIGAYDGVWMPTVGERTDRIDIEDMSAERSGVTAENLYMNRQSQTVVNSRGVSEGDTYDLTYEPYVEPTGEQLRTAKFADIELPENAPIDELTQFAQDWVGDSDSDFEKFRNLSRAVKTDGFYSNGLADETASLSGHGASRLLAMLEDIGFDKEAKDAQPLGRIGDEEQYAALIAALARSIDIPARVVMGFQVPPGQEGTVDITGEAVTAWVEVAFEDVGWVRFDPAPDEDDQPTEPEKTEVDKPLPQVAQPPPPPAEPPTPPPGAMGEDADKDSEEEDPAASWLVLLGYALIPVGLIALAILAVVIAKAVRRRRRRTRGALPARIDGGWQEILDLMTDLGHRPDPLMTRAETAARLEADIPAAGALTLAGRADRAVFGPDDLPEAASDEYWAHVMSARRTMSGAVPWHRRLRAAISLRSFRRRSAERRGERRRERINARARRRAQRRTQMRRRRPWSLRGMVNKPRTSMFPRKGRTR
ncbi:transglutaminase domain-containing protein [Brachybacterium sp. AOP43-C2-M15]|uniref:transglutaminase domain-containing protein n=1 Tax=Brachybacterium sp. AOP43-C2-M15 TaxID=3457661 RepID=UPI00403343EE